MGYSRDSIKNRLFLVYCVLFIFIDFLSIFIYFLSIFIDLYWISSIFHWFSMCMGSQGTFLPNLGPKLEPYQAQEGPNFIRERIIFFTEAGVGGVY